MNKKIVYVLIVVVLIVAGVFVAKKISENGETKQTSANTLENKNDNKVENKIQESNDNESNNNEANVNNTVVEPETNVVEDNKTETGNTNKNPENEAKQIVLDNWGEDDTVYFSYDGKDNNGRYIICVREKSSTKALYWYYVDIQTGAFEIK